MNSAAAQRKSDPGRANRVGPLRPRQGKSATPGSYALSGNNDSDQLSAIGGQLSARFFPGTRVTNTSEGMGNRFWPHSPRRDDAERDAQGRLPDALTHHQPDPAGCRTESHPDSDLPRSRNEVATELLRPEPRMPDGAGRHAFVLRGQRAKSSQRNCSVTSGRAVVRRRSPTSRVHRWR